MELLNELKAAVRNEIRKDCWKEAYQILELGDDKDREDFLRYHKEDKGNICCLVLDFAKGKLVEFSTLEYKEGDCFKDPRIWLNEK